MIYLGRNPVGVAVKQTDEWVRPAEYPDLDSIEMPDYDCVYFTCDLRLESTIPVLSIICAADAFELGHLENSVFVVDKSIENTSRVDLDTNDGLIQLWRIRRSIRFTEFRINATAGSAYETARLTPVVEIRAKFRSCGTFSPANRSGFGIVTLRSLRIYNDADYAMSYMLNNCFNLKRLIIEGAGKPNNIAYAFNNMGEGAKCIDFTKLDLSKCTSARGPFSSYSFFDTVDLSESGLVNAQDNITKSYFLYDSPKIQNLNLANTDFGANMFLNSAAVREFTPGKIYETNINLSSATNLSKASVLRIIDALPSTSQALTLTLAVAPKSLLTTEEIAVATQKGWTIV